MFIRCTGRSSTVQMLLAYAKAICVALTVGDLRRRVGRPLAVASSEESHPVVARASEQRATEKRRFDIGVNSGWVDALVGQHVFYQEAVGTARSATAAGTGGTSTTEMTRPTIVVSVVALPAVVGLVTPGPPRLSESRVGCLSRPICPESPAVLRRCAADPEGPPVHRPCA